MTKCAALLVAYAAVVSANPEMPVVFSEIQTAPDSLQRIELHLYAGDQVFDLSGPNSSPTLEPQ
jgi:predicted acyltransferase